MTTVCLAPAAGSYGVLCLAWRRVCERAPCEVATKAAKRVDPFESRLTAIKQVGLKTHQQYVQLNQWHRQRRRVAVQRKINRRLFCGIPGDRTFISGVADGVTENDSTVRPERSFNIYCSDVILNLNPESRADLSFNFLALAL